MYVYLGETGFIDTCIRKNQKKRAKLQCDSVASDIVIGATSTATMYTFRYYNQKQYGNLQRYNHEAD